MSTDFVSRRESDDKSDSGKVRVWTVQPEEVWLKLQEQKSLLVDPDLSQTYQDWPDSVDWMREQMRKRLPGYQGNVPWWAWYTPKPDIRKLRHGACSGAPETYVRIELLIAKDRVLISQIMAWTYVLLRVAVPYTNLEGDYWFNVDEKLGGRVRPKRIQARVEATWERIFALDLPSRDPDCDKTHEYELWQEHWWQATFEELRLDDVCKYTVFVTTPTKKDLKR